VDPRSMSCARAFLRVALQMPQIPYHLIPLHLLLQLLSNHCQ
jgi:hypothetical protein